MSVISPGLSTKVNFSRQFILTVPGGDSCFWSVLGFGRVEFTFYTDGLGSTTGWVATSVTSRYPVRPRSEFRYGSGEESDVL